MATTVVPATIVTDDEVRFVIQGPVLIYKLVPLLFC